MPMAGRVGRTRRICPRAKYVAKKSDIAAAVENLDARLRREGEEKRSQNLSRSDSAQILGLVSCPEESSVTSCRSPHSASAGHIPAADEADDETWSQKNVENLPTNGIKTVQW